MTDLAAWIQEYVQRQVQAEADRVEAEADRVEAEIRQVLDSGEEPVILTGGIGAGQVITEAEFMRRYHQLPPSRNG